MKNSQLLEKENVKQVIGPVDLVAGQTGSRVSMKGSEKVAFLIAIAAGAVTTSFTLKQHNAASGGTTKDLEVANPYFHKVGAAEVFTKVEPTVAAAVKDLSAVVGGAKALIVLEVNAEDLDVNGGFSHVSVDSAAAGAACLGSVTAHAHENRQLPCYNQAL